MQRLAKFWLATDRYSRSISQVTILLKNGFSSFRALRGISTLRNAATFDPPSVDAIPCAFPIFSLYPLRMFENCHSRIRLIPWISFNFQHSPDFHKSEFFKAPPPKRRSSRWNLLRNLIFRCEIFENWFASREKTSIILKLATRCGRI